MSGSFAVAHEVPTITAVVSQEALQATLRPVAVVTARARCVGPIIGAGAYGRGER